MDLTEEIRRLVELEGRGPGTNAERRAARQLEERLRALGREVEAEPLDTWPNWALAYTLLIVMAIAGSLLSVSVPVVGVVLVFVAMLLLFLDAGGGLPVARRLLGRRASQNLVSGEDGDKAGRLIVVAHYDAGRTGAGFHRRLAEGRASLARLLRRKAVGPLHPVMAALALVLLCCIARLFKMEGLILTVVQFLPTVGLILVVPLLIDVAVARPAPGAGDNASGVAMALRLAEHYGGSLEHFDLTVLLTGAQESLADGMRSYLRRHRGELDRSRSVFINLDEVASGTVRYTLREGLLVSASSHSQLVDICEEIAEDDEEGDGGFGARGMVSRAPSDGAAARGRGYPAITISCRNDRDYAPEHHQPSDTPERVDPEALERAYGFCSQLIERLDASIGPDLELDRDHTMLTEDEAAA
ncbi:MAG: M28 family metallopeptidase [Thermoleophilaceae bacterium]